MKTLSLPGLDRPAPNVVLGLMRIQDLDDDAVRPAYLYELVPDAVPPSA